MRSDAASLEIPAKVYGSRVIASAGANTAQTEPFTEETNTIIVFRRGGVLRMTTALSVGQMLVLTNLKTGQDAICRVAKVRSLPDARAYVEIEFTQPQTAFWGVDFTSEDGTNRHDPSAAARQPMARAAAETLRSSTHAHVSRASTSTGFAPPATQPASLSGSFGPQEKAQAAAAATSATIPLAPLLTLKQPYPLEQKRGEAAYRESSEDAAKAAKADDCPTPESLPSLEHSAEVETEAFIKSLDAANSDVPFKSLSATSELASDSADTIRQAFQARLEAESSQSAAPKRRPHRVLIGASAAVLFVTLAGSISYFRSKGRHDTAVNPVTASLFQGPPSNPAQPRASMEAGLASSSGSTPNGISRPVPSSEASVAIGTSRPAAKSDDPVAARSRPLKGLLTPKVMKAHPHSAVRGLNPQNPAPVLDTTTLPSLQPVGLPGLASSTIAVPRPGGTQGPVPVGGAVKEPKLVSAPLPSYPPVAKQARVQGDVVIDTQIDKSGRVSQTKIVSGPAMLQQAALDALRRWRYEPSHLDGQTVEVEMLVKVRFRL